MRFSILLSLSVAGAMAATPVEQPPSLVRRDLATITGVINSIQSQAAALDASVKAFSGDFTTLAQSAAALQSAIEDGNTKIKATDAISLTDALTLQSVVNGLTTTVNTTVDDLIAKKAAFVSAGLGSTVLASLQAQNTASAALAASIVSKVPSAVQSLAQQLSAGITDALKRGITAFQDQAGASGTPASGTPAASSKSAAATVTQEATPSKSAAVSSRVSGAPSATRSASSGFGKPTSATSLPAFTGAAMPTAHAGMGMGLAAALAVAAAAL